VIFSNRLHWYVKLNSVRICLKELGVRCCSIWNFAQALKFKTEFHSKMESAYVNWGGGGLHPNPSGNSHTKVKWLWYVNNIAQNQRVLGYLPNCWQKRQIVGAVFQVCNLQVAVDIDTVFIQSNVTPKRPVARMTGKTQSKAGSSAHWHKAHHHSWCNVINPLTPTVDIWVQL